MKNNFVTRKGKQKIIAFLPNRGRDGIRNPDKPDSKYCILEVNGKPVAQWVRSRNIIEDHSVDQGAS